MDLFRRIGQVAVFILLLTSTMAGASGAENVTAENATVGGLSESPQHGYNASEIQAGLSLDPDTNYQTDADFQNDTYGAYVDADDVTYTRPRTVFREWNKKEHKDFSPGGETESRYPESATLYDGHWIRDAHATRFRHSPSTIGYYNNTTVRYVGSEGTVRGVIDYRVKQPISDSRPGNPHQLETFRTRDLTGHSIKSVCLIRKLERSQIVDRDDVCRNDPWVIGTASPGPNPTISYEQQNQGWSTNYTLVAVIEAQVNVEVEQYRDNDNDGEYDPEWDTVDSYTANDEVIVTDQWKATPYSLGKNAFSQSNRSGNLYEDNRSGVYYQPPEHPWAGLQVDDTYISSDWRFYNHRNTGWDTITEKSNRGGKTTTKYEAVPIQKYAVPSPHGVNLQQPENGSKIGIHNVEQKEKLVVPSEAGNENLTVDIAGNQSQSLPRNYSRVTGVTVQGENIGYDNVTSIGAVNGTRNNASEVPLRFTVDRKESELIAQVDEANSTHVAVNIKLLDENGDPIALGNRHKGVIRLPTNETIRTNRTGQARVVIENHTSGQIRYEPESWQGKQVAYKPSSALYKAYPAFKSQESIFDWGVGILIMLLPVALPWYYIRQFENIDYWKL